MSRPVDAYHSLFIPSQAVGASKVFFDLFNGTTQEMRVRQVRAIKDGTTAVTGVVSVQMFLTRTTAVGTGGTPAASEGASLTAATFAKNSIALDTTNVTARLGPGGGATAGAVISERQIFPEETTGVNYDPLTRFLEKTLSVPAGTGIRVVQGSVASVGNVGFDVEFEMVP